MTASVTIVDDDPSAFVQMLAALIEANLDRAPKRSRLLLPATVELEALDAGLAATVRLRPGVVEVAGGHANPGFDVRIRAGGRDLLELAAAPLRAGFPDPLRREGRAVLGAVVRGRVHIAGLVRHPLVLARFARLLSVA